MTAQAKADRAMEILQAAGHDWSMDLADAVSARIRVCDGKDTPSKIARHVAKSIKA